MASAPPPYSSPTSERHETNLPISVSGTAAPLQLTTADISGLRAQILDNAPTLFMLAHNNSRMVPNHFHINTIKSPATGQVQACIVVFPSSTLRGQGTVHLFVQGPLADSTELALRGLLEKVEGMLGRKWIQGLENRNLTKELLVQSVDDPRGSASAITGAYPTRS